MRSFIRLPGAMAAVALAGAALTASAPGALAQPAVSAATINVPCSTAALVAAINSANTSLTPTTLVLARPCTYSISAPAAVGDGLPVITRNITLQGGTNTVIRRSPFTILPFRILDVATSGTLTVDRISILNGNTPALGGGIQNAGTLFVSHSRLSGNNAGNGGGLANGAGATATVSSTLFNQNTTTGVGGGAIINSGTLTLFNCVLDSNTAPINGGGLNTQGAGVSRLIQSTVTHNTSGGLGGGISNLGTTSLDGSQVRLNTGSAGGGIATGNNNVTLRSSIVKKNSPDNCSPLNTIAGCAN